MSSSFLLLLMFVCFFLLRKHVLLYQFVFGEFSSFLVNGAWVLQLLKDGLVQGRDFLHFLHFTKTKGEIAHH